MHDDNLTPPSTPPLDLLAEAVDHEHREYLRHAVSACESAWAIGDYLIKAREHVAHGHWGAWVADRSMTSRFASRCVRIRQNYELAELAGRSLRSALASIAGPETDPEPDPPEPAKSDTRVQNEPVLDDRPPSPAERETNADAPKRARLTPTDKRIVRDAGLEQRAQSAEARAETAETTIKALEDELFNATGQRSRVASTISGAHERARAAEAKLARANEDIADLRREVAGLRRRIGELLREAEARRAA